MVSQTQGEWEAPKEEVPLKDWHDFTVIGQPLPRRDFEAKLTGQAIYGYDARLEGMKYGAVIRPPTVAATLKSVAPGQAAAMPGVHTVVAEKDFGGVVADSRAQARAAVNQMEVAWEPGHLWQQAELEAIVTVGNGNGITIQDEGDAEGKLRERDDPHRRIPHAFRRPRASGGPGRAGRRPARQGAHLVLDPGPGPGAQRRGQGDWA